MDAVEALIIGIPYNIFAYEHALQPVSYQYTYISWVFMVTLWVCVVAAAASRSRDVSPGTLDSGMPTHNLY